MLSARSWWIEWVEVSNDLQMRPSIDPVWSREKFQTTAPYRQKTLPPAVCWVRRRRCERQTMCQAIPRGRGTSWSGQTYCGAQLIDDKDDVELEIWMKFQIPWPVRLACAQAARQGMELASDTTCRLVVPELPYQIFAQIRHVCHATLRDRETAAGWASMTGCLCECM